MQIQTVGSYEAKTHLPQLLREVQGGKVFDISIRGQVVARLAPATAVRPQHEAAAVKMREFMQKQQVSGTGVGLDLHELINEGRA